MRHSPIVQLAYFVEDIEQAAEQWAKEYGAGPFFVAKHIQLDAVSYRGQESTLDHSSAYGQLGSMMLEFVQVHSDQESVFSGCKYGLHHMACFAEDLNGDLSRYQAAGCETAMKANVQEMTYAFVDTRKTLGHYTELYQDCDLIRGFYAMVHQASVDWDGQQLIRSL